MKQVFATLTVVGALAMAAPAQAMAIESVYNFEATFLNGPNSKIDGSVTLFFDSKDYVIPIVFRDFSSSAFLGYVVKPKIDGRLVVIGNCDLTECSVRSGMSEFYLGFIFDGDGNVSPNASSLAYAVAGVSELFFTTNVTFGRVASAPVPEPGTWALMILGFGAVGYAMRRRSKAVVRFA